MITYKKDGILIDDNFISLHEIKVNCLKKKIEEEELLLLKLEWKGWRGFSEGIKEQIVLSMDKIETIKKYLLGKTINFGEINGKHSEIYNTLDDNDIEIDSDINNILHFLLSKPNGHEYNHSFLYKLHDKMLDGCYDDISDEEIESFGKCF